MLYTSYKTNKTCWEHLSRFFKRSHQACILFCLHNYIAQECVLKLTLEKPAKMPQLSVWHFSALLKKKHTKKIKATTLASQKQHFCYYYIDETLERARRRASTKL